MISRSKNQAYHRHSKRVELGYSIRQQSKIGFQSDQPAASQMISVSDELPILTFAPTGRGKGVSAIIPTLLTNDRTMIVLDPKGENYAVTARARREMGHEVYALDPFNVAVKKSDSLNPMDLLKLPGVSIEAESYMLAESIGHDFQSKKESFWDEHAKGTISGLIALGTIDPYVANLLTLRDHLVGEDPIHKIAVALDFLTEKKLTQTMAYRELAAFMNQSERETRPSVLASAGAYTKIFNTDRVAKVVEKSTVQLTDIIENKPMTIYLIIPTTKLNSHRALLRLWLATTMAAIQSRKKRPKESTLFLIDECGQLGGFELLKTAVTLSRGFGVQPWLFFQSLNQLKENYGEAWRTFIDNAGAVQAFGFANMFGGLEWGEFFGWKAKALLNLPIDNQLLYIPGEGTIESRRLNYLKDEQYRGLFDPNPYFYDNGSPGERN